MSGLNLVIDKTLASFGVALSTGSVISLLFNEAPEDFFIGGSGDAVSFYCSNETQAVVFSEPNKVIAAITREGTFPVGLSVSLVGAQVAEVDETEIVLFNERDRLLLSVTGGTVSASDSTILLSLTDAQMKIEITQSEGLKSSVEFSAQAIANYVVAPGARRPEFTLEVFDDALLTIPRQTRYGVPVISTVPAIKPTTTDYVQSVYYEEGRGPKSKTIYFKATSNISLATTPVFLQIWLPHGLETVSAPMTVSMVDSGDHKTFTASFVFHKEDTVNYVDGFAFSSVYVPLTVQGYLHLGLTVDSDSSGSINTRPETNYELSAMALIPEEQPETLADSQVEDSVEPKDKKGPKRWFKKGN